MLNDNARNNHIHAKEIHYYTQIFRNIDSEGWVNDSRRYGDYERNVIIDREVRVIKFRGDPSKLSGIVEVRGIVNKDSSLSFGEYTQYDNEFGKFYRD
jgi:hypothetical protein